MMLRTDALVLAGLLAAAIPAQAAEVDAAGKVWMVALSSVVG